MEAEGRGSGQHAGQHALLTCKWCGLLLCLRCQPCMMAGLRRCWVLDWSCFRLGWDPSCLSGQLASWSSLCHLWGSIPDVQGPLSLQKPRRSEHAAETDAERVTLARTLSM